MDHPFHLDYRHRDAARPPSRTHTRTRTRSSSPDQTHNRHTRRRHHHSHHLRHHRSSRNHRHDRDHRETKTKTQTQTPVDLPLNARPLTKHDLALYEPMFAMYLDIQKGMIMEDLSSEEVKGRWKSFVGKWNRGELAEGWYDLNTLEKARRGAQEEQAPSMSTGGRRASPHYGGHTGQDDDMDDGDNNDEDEEYGPSLPAPGNNKRPGGGPSSGPTIPMIHDLELRKEYALEDALQARDIARKHHTASIRSHNAEMRQLHDELAPRAEPGTHERRMEKRQETAASNRAFAESRRGGSPGGEAAPDEELMGSGADDLMELKRTQEREQRKKNEREIRREEILRARAVEREERVQRYREKEEETIGWLKTLAKQRFG